jgi:Zn-dependent protease with chaperone function
MRAPLGVVVAVVGLLLAGAAQAESDAPPAKPPLGKMIARTNFAPIDAKAMIAGQAAELTLLRAYGLKTVRAPELVAYLIRIADRLQAKAKTSAPVRIVIEAEDEPNAGAAEHGTIKVTLGLIRAAQNEDELAFILAHEIAHVLLRHHDKNWGDAARQYLMRGAVVAADVSKGIAQAKGTPPSASVDKAMLAYTGIDLASGVAIASFTREQEDEADLLAIDLLIAAGYNAAAAAQVIARLPELEPRASSPSHGRTASQSAARRATQPNQGVGEFLGAMFQSMGEAVRAGIQDLRSESSRRHRTGDERSAYIAEYLAQEYPRRPRPTFAAEALAAARSAAPVKAAIAQHEAAWKANERIKANDLRAAESAAAAALANGGERQIEPALAAARVRWLRGQRKEALALLNTVAKSGDPSIHVALGRAFAYENQNNLNEAARILEAASEQFDGPALAMPPLIRVYRHLNRTHDANLLLAKCRYTYPQIADRCTAGA